MNDYLEDVLDFSLDNQIQEIKDLKWLPWIGKSFFKTPTKLLIVGESHYTGQGQESINELEDIRFTRDCVFEQGYENLYHVRLYQNIHRMLMGNKSFDTKNLWRNLSYHNFIQIPLSNISIRPSYQDFFKSAPVFWEILKVLKPKYCLMCGLSSEGALINFLTSINVEIKSKKGIRSIPKVNDKEYPREYIIKIDNDSVNLIYVYHPSRQRNSNNWNDYLKSTYPELMNELYIHV